MWPAPDHKHYIPILRWKQGEKRALSKLFRHGTDTSMLTPLIEPMPGDFTPDAFPTMAAAVNQIAYDIFDHWGSQQEIFIDLGRLSKELCMRAGTYALILLDRAAQQWQCHLNPVIRLQSDTQYRAAVKALIHPTHPYPADISKRRTCLRLSPNEIMHQNIEQQLVQLSEDLRVAPANIDFRTYAVEDFSRGDSHLINNCYSCEVRKS